MTENNVIQFPKSYESQEDDKVRLPQTEDEVMKAIAVNRMVFVDEVVNQTFSNIATKFYHQGFPVDEDEFFRDFIMIGELTRSILYNSVGIEHPMHGVVTENRAKLKKLMDSGDIKFTDSSDEDNDEYYEDDDN
jgi:hypothetical protein|tara:strand:- start:84 stop:485 length:402 start_codon:yes stop_codon:yes gene_type:complete